MLATKAVPRLRYFTKAATAAKTHQNKTKKPYMQASETKIRHLVEGAKQYVVPLFQRPYSWSEKQWKTLWNDVLEQSRHHDGRPHFFGSIVTSPARSVPQGVGKYLLIDGQQRITTVQVLLAAIRDLASKNGEVRLAEKIDGQYLTNAYEEGDDRLKVLPTQDDRAAFRAVMQRSGIPESRLRQCYDFFVARLGRIAPDNFDRIHASIVDRLSIVSITCDDYDNPHLIFESLNAKGEKLTPADLIRNFLLMRVHVGDQGRLFQAYWLPIQHALDIADAHLTEFVRHYLMKEGKILKEADVYFELKDRLANASPLQAEEFLVDLHRHGMFYAKFVNPNLEPDQEVAQRLERLRRLKFTVAYPFLLRVFDSSATGALSRDQLLQTLDMLESFLVRRSICNVPSNQLRRMLPPAFDAVGGASPTFTEGLREQLGGSRCPDDESFARALATESLYSTTEKNTRLRLILERLERSFNHREQAEVSGAQIEHVMPQTLTPEWVEEIGQEHADESSRLLHTLGNLTLTKYNGELSNKPYSYKRGEFLKSNYVLNNYFEDVDRWTPNAIRERGLALAQIALRIWPDFGRTARPAEGERQATSPPVEIRFREVHEPVVNWKDAFIKMIKHFESSCPNLLSMIANENTLPSVVTLDKDRFRRSSVQFGGVFVNTHASAATLRHWCRKIANIASIDTEDFEFIGSDRS